MRFDAKPKSRRKWLLAVAVPIVALLIAGKTMNSSPPTNAARTTPDGAPDIRTRVYRQTPDEVMQASRQVISQQKTWGRAWRITPQPQVRIGAAQFEISVEVPVLIFTDDLNVDIAASENGTVVNVESKSRVGQGDFGENRRHIAGFLKALDEALVKRGT